MLKSRQDRKTVSYVDFAGKKRLAKLGGAVTDYGTREGKKIWWEANKAIAPHGLKEIKEKNIVSISDFEPMIEKLANTYFNARTMQKYCDIYKTNLEDNNDNDNDNNNNNDNKINNNNNSKKVKRGKMEIDDDDESNNQKPEYHRDLDIFVRIDGSSKAQRSFVLAIAAFSSVFRGCFVALSAIFCFVPFVFLYCLICV